MKLLSIIVPVYNVKSYLKKCVESIINQTYTNLQIILVDISNRSYNTTYENKISSDR